MVRIALLLLLVAAVLVACSEDDAEDAVIEILGTAPGEPSAFTVTGTAADTGVLCGTGVAQWIDTYIAETGEPESEPPVDGTALWVDFEFTCQSGTFVLRSEETVDNAAVEQGIATGEVVQGGDFTVLSGTGDYASLTGEGDRTFQFIPGGGVRDVYTGSFASN
jgi:hypothetical protein